jgi:hypothetical protein
MLKRFITEVGKFPEFYMLRIPFIGFIFHAFFNLETEFFQMTLHFVFLSNIRFILTHLLAYGAEPFLRSSQLCSSSRAFRYFMEPEGLICVHGDPNICDAAASN